MSEDLKTPTNWPNPERPGVPLFADRDGAHVFEYDNDSDLLIVYHWDSKESCWLEFPTGSRKEWDKRPDLDVLKYHGPVLTPTQIAEMLAGERDRCAKVCEDAYEKSGRDFEYLGCNDAASQIRNLGYAA